MVTIEMSVQHLSEVLLAQALGWMSPPHVNLSMYTCHLLEQVVFQRDIELVLTSENNVDKVV